VTPLQPAAGAQGGAAEGVAPAQGAARLHSTGALHLLLAAAVLLPLLVAGAGAWVAWRQAWDISERELVHVADAGAEYVRRVLDGNRFAAARVNDLLRGLTDDEIRAREAELHAALRRMIADMPPVATAYVGDRNGRLLLSATVYPVPRDVDVADREYYTSLTAPGAPDVVVTRVYQGRVEDNLFFAVAMRRRDSGNPVPDDQFDGQANVSVDPRDLGAGLSRLLSHQDDSIILLRADGYLLARHPSFNSPPPRLADAHPIAEAMRASPSGVVLAASRMDGVMRLTAFRPVEGWPGLSVSAGRPQAAIVRDWRDDALKQLGFAVPAMLALALLARLVERGRRRLAAANVMLERRVAERTTALRDSEERLRLTTVGAGVGTFEIDMRDGLGRLSPEAMGLFGVARASFGTADWKVVVHPLDHAAVAMAWGAAVAQRSQFHAVFRAAAPAPDGRMRWLLARARMHFTAKGEPQRIAGVLLDVTALRRTEEALRDSEARFRASQELSPLAFSIQRAVRDPQGAVVDFEIEYANPAAHRMGGVPPGALLGQRLMARLPQARSHPLLFARYVAILSGQVPPSEEELEINDAALHGWFRCAVVRLDEERIAVSIDDVTAERAAREALARSHAELEALVEARTAALLRAADERRRAEETARQSEKLAALGLLVGGVAHDFNNLLQVIASGAALLRRPTLTEERRIAVLDGMIKAGDTARDMTGRLLAFARQQPLTPETFDLNTRLLGMSELLRQTLGGGCRVETDLAPDLWPVRADPGQLELAVLNLAVNARDAMNNGGRLVLHTRNATLPASSERAAGDYVCVAVEDSGAGMLPAVLARALEPYFTTKEPGRGTGLGLPQAFGFARQSGGDLTVESEHGTGTTVTIYLPRAGPCAEDAADGPPAAMRAPKHRTVLVVEDNEAAGEFAASLLEELGYATRRASTAAEALAAVARGGVDAVFSDIVMPGGTSGRDLAAVLRRERPGMAVVLASGYSPRGGGVGPDDVETLPKPYQLVELAAALERAFARVTAAAG